MPITKILCLLVAVVALVHAQGCANDCSGRGKCIENRCVCNNGFFGDDCSDTVAEAKRDEWLSARIVICIVYGLLLILYTYILYLSIRARHNSQEEDVHNGLFNARNFIIGFAVGICVFTLLNWAVDPNGGNGVYPYLLYRYIFGIIFPLFSSLFCTILFHWKNIYDHASKTLKKEEMLQKINTKYQSNLTLADVLREAKVVRAGGWLYFILNALAWIFQFIRETLLGLRVTTTKTAMQPTWMAFFGIIFISETLGIIFYGVRLAKIMPQVMVRRMRIVTFKIMGIAITFCIVWIIITVILSQKVVTAEQYVALEYVSRLAFATILVAVATLFMSISKEFPFVKFNLAQDRTSSHSSGTELEASEKFQSDSAKSATVSMNVTVTA